MANKVQQHGKQLKFIITAPFITALLGSDKTSPAQAQDLLALAHTNNCANTYVYRAYTGLLARAGDFNAIENTLERMHAQKVSYDANILTALASAYFKQRESDKVIATVQRIADERLRMNATAAGFMVYEYALRGDLAEALRWFTAMRKAHMELSVDVFRSIMHVIADKGEYADFTQVAHDLHERHMYTDNKVCSDILRFYARLGYTQEAQSVFEYMKAHKMVPFRAAYNALLDDLNKQSAIGQEDAAKAKEMVISDMTAQGYAMTRRAYQTAVETYTKRNDQEQLERFAEEMSKHGIEPQVGDYNVRIRAWAAQGNAERCEALVREMEARGIRADQYTLGSMLNCYSQNLTHESLRKCEEWWNKMKAEEEVKGSRPEVKEKEKRAIEGAKELPKGEVKHEVKQEAAKEDGIKEVQSKENLQVREVETKQIDTAIEKDTEKDSTKKETEEKETTEKQKKQEGEKTAHTVQGKREERKEKEKERILNTSTYNVMMRIYAKMMLPEKCAQLFKEMKENNIAPDLVTFNTMIQAWVRRGAKKEIENLRSEMRRLGIFPDDYTYSCLLKIIAKKSPNPNDVAEIRKEMAERGVKMTVHMYTTLIDMYGKQKEGKKCIEMWKEMRKNGVVPSDVTRDVMRKYVDLQKEGLT